VSATGPTGQGPDGPILVVDHVSHSFTVQRAGREGGRRGQVSALSDVSFSVSTGETFAIVGETGSGKSTLARAILREPPPMEGSIALKGQDITHLKGKAALESRREIQMVFQDPFSALNPRWRVERIVTEPLAVHGIGNQQYRHGLAAQILNLVGLDLARHGARFPRELSGGQCQRVAIARALVVSPSIVICDEPVTALDVSIQAQILNLLADLRERLHLTYLLIAHDLMIVQTLSHRVGTMYLGKLCEIGPTQMIFDRPAHPYTAALLSAIPARPGIAATSGRLRLQGEPPSPLDPPSGCRFRTRCVLAQSICADQAPELKEVAPGQFVSCHFPFEIHNYTAAMKGPRLGAVANSDSVSTADHSAI
jgi:oligopeptide/dipeptide ABC transporter ATP-binding protein